MRPGTAKRSILECAASWPGTTLRELIESEELPGYTEDHLMSAASELRRSGYLAPFAYPSILHVKEGWEQIVRSMWKRDQSFAAAVSAGAHTYSALSDALGRTKNSLYCSSSRLIRAGAIYNPRGLYLTEMGEAIFRDVTGIGRSTRPR